jgi:hypothetical protein
VPLVAVARVLINVILPGAIVDGPPPELSPVADCGLGVEVALTALLKCMTGG